MNSINRQGRRRNPLDWMYFMDGPKRVCVQDAALYNNIAVQERERGPHRLAGHVIALACATRRPSYSRKQCCCLPSFLITLLTIGEMDFYPNSRRKLDLQKVHLTFDHQVHSSCR